jgi:hypothetical protein
MLVRECPMTGKGPIELKRLIENDDSSDRNAENDNAGGKNVENDDRSDAKAKIGNGNDRNVVTRGNVGREIIQIGIKDIQANGPMLMNSPTATKRTHPVNNVGSLSSL